LIKPKQNKDQKPKPTKPTFFLTRNQVNFTKIGRNLHANLYYCVQYLITSLCFLYKKVAAKFFQSLRKKPGQVGVHQGTEARVKNGKEINWKHPTTLKETPLA
jgi:hypothetical protein